MKNFTEQMICFIIFGRVLKFKDMNELLIIFVMRFSDLPPFKKI